MDNKTLLQAMRQMMQEELTPINQKIDNLGARVDEMTEEIHIVHGRRTRSPNGLKTCKLT